ncbi:MAG: cell division protein FtsA [bacterium]|nr:cell division protein FtsA [bacterium]
MQDSSKYAVGIDIGTTTVRCVVGHIDNTSGTPTIVGVGQAPNSGMRKGMVVNLSGPGHAIDEALGEAERMSGYQVDDATLSINGSNILSTKTDGMIATSGTDHAISQDDLARLQEVSTVGKVPANRQVLEVVPHSYRLDGQDNIKDPINMTGTRLEMRANVISVLTPTIQNLQKASELATVNPRIVMPSVMAAANAVLTESQVENGVALVDLGGATTSIAIYEEGDLQYLSVIPAGGINITNDLAIGLKTDPEIAEKVKLAHASAMPVDGSSGVTIKHENETHSFKIDDVNDIVGARLDDMFENIQKELKKAGRAGKLPSGVVLTGGTAKIKHIAEYTKQSLGLAARVAKPSGYGGVTDNIDTPEFATAIGLMLVDSQGNFGENSGQGRSSGKSAKKIGDAKNALSKFLDRFRA